MNAHDHAAHPAGCDTEVLNALLRGELSAVETYDRAAADFEGQPAAADLDHIRADHAEAVALLREQVRRFGGEPAAGSGPWGTFTAAVTCTARAVGPATTLHALQQGEQHGVGEYEAALGNDAVHPDCKNAIRTRLLPKSREHVLELDRLMAGKQ